MNEEETNGHVQQEEPNRPAADAHPIHVQDLPMETTDTTAHVLSELFSVWQCDTAALEDCLAVVHRLCHDGVVGDETGHRIAAVNHFILECIPPRLGRNDYDGDEAVKSWLSDAERPEAEFWATIRTHFDELPGDDGEEEGNVCDAQHPFDQYVNSVGNYIGSGAIAPDDPQQFCSLFSYLNTVERKNIKNGTLQRLRNRFTEMWVNFCQSKGYPGPAEKNAEFLSPSNEVNVDLAREWLQYLDRHSETTCSVWEQGLDFAKRSINWMCNIQNVINKGPELGKHGFVKNLKKQWREKTAAEDMDQKDLLQFLNSRVDFGARLRVIDYLYKARTKAAKGIGSILMRLTIVMAMLHTFATQQRGGDAKETRIGMSFVHKMRMLGPDPDGMETDAMISNKNKTNRAGKKEYKTVAPHKNPRLDYCANSGLVLLQRFCIEKEPFPMFEEPKDFVYRPLYRAMTDHTKTINERLLGNAWQKAYEKNGIHVDKIMHMGRKQGQQELEEEGVPTSHISRHSSYKTGNPGESTPRQDLHYLNHPTTTCVTSRALGDWQNPRLFSRKWVEPKVTEELFRMVGNNFGNFLLDERQKLAEEAEGMTSKTKGDKKLYMAMGSLDSMIRKVEMAIRLVASRILNEKHELADDAKTFYETYKTEMEILDMPMFESDEFKALVEEMKKAQEEEASLDVEIPPRLSHQITTVFEEYVKPQFDKLVMALQTTNTILARVQEENNQLRQENRQLHEENQHLRNEMDLVSLKVDRLTSMVAGALHCHIPDLPVDDTNERVADEMQADDYSGHDTEVDHPGMSLAQDDDELQRHGQVREELQQSFVQAPPSQPTVAGLRFVEHMESVAPETTTKGRERKRKPKLERRFAAGASNSFHFSNDVRTVEGLWAEFNNPWMEDELKRSPRQLEESGDRAWRRDPTLESNGKRLRTTSVKAAWAKRSPIFSMIVYHISAGMDEASAIADVRQKAIEWDVRLRRDTNDGLVEVSLDKFAKKLNDWFRSNGITKRY